MPSHRPRRNGRGSNKSVANTGTLLKANGNQLNTVVVCVLTSNLKRAAVPGNVAPEKGEGNLPRPSVVVVSQVFTVDKAQLQEYIGTLPAGRVRQILDGLRLIIEPKEAPR